MLDDEQTKPVLLACYRDAKTRADLERAASGFPASDEDDQDSYDSFTDGDSSSGNAVSLHGHVPENTVEPGPAARASTNGAASSHRSSSVHSLAVNQPADVDPAEEFDNGIVLHVEVSGILDPSEEFGTVQDFLAVVKRLTEIEDERVEREAITRLAKAVAPKTTAWLQGISDVNEFEDAVEDARESLKPGDGVVQEAPAETSAELQSLAASAERDVQLRSTVSDHSATHPQLPADAIASTSPDVSALAPSSPPPNEVAPVMPEDETRPESLSLKRVSADLVSGHSADLKTRTPSPQFSSKVTAETSVAESPKDAEDGSARAFSSHLPNIVTTAVSVPEDSNIATEAPKDLEAGKPPAGVLQSKAGAGNADGSPRPRTLRALLALLISRIRALVAKCRALF
ncbi:hypothetical protein AURDEDRAFT_116171 [Auricularia subglabra TFB-10046 SS5]|nr:hypothetical protein AURDEDRAFT_116171 [Auricularia subglabra TFB-10046 SS5]